MIRTSLYKFYYFGILLVFVLITGFSSNFSTGWGICTALLVILPGRILGYFWRDLLRGLNLLRLKRYEESIRYSREFLKTLERRPWIKHLIWLGSSAYSRNPKALAYNNLGAAELGLGRLEEARANLEESIRQDSLNPLPFHNLALLAKKQGNTEEAELMHKSAYQRGLTFGRTDQMVMASQKRFAEKEGRIE